MKFAKIIEEAGFNACQFPRSSFLPVTLYDGKDRVLDKVHYNEELFAANTMSAVNFFSFLNYLETKTVSEISVKIDEHSVIVFYGTDQAVCFRRTSSMDPLDYMS